MSVNSPVSHFEHFIRDAFFDFKLSREAINCTPSTLDFYDFTTGKWVEWLVQEGVTDPADLRSAHVRAYLVYLRERDLKASTLNGHARAIKTFTRFLHAEGYMENLITFEMPKIPDKRPLVLTAEQLDKVLDKGCETPRDRSLILVLADTGLRRAEACALKWGRVDLKGGLINVRNGKGGKDRSVMIGAKARRSLLRYSRTVPNDTIDPVFPSKRTGDHLTGQGMRNWVRRISNRSGIKVTPHALRRTFATLSLRAGMNPLHLQALMGHSTLEMTRRYIQLVEDDLKEAHKKHGPVDRWLR